MHKLGQSVNYKTKITFRMLGISKRRSNTLKGCFRKNAEFKWREVGVEAEIGGGTFGSV